MHALARLFARAQWKALKREENSTKPASTAGVMDLQFFRSVAQREINRCTRYQRPCTAACLDIDDFMHFNESYGRATGDNLLRLAAETMALKLRKTDVVARLGSSEFVILLPEVGAQRAATVVSKVHSALERVMQANEYPATFSTGVVSFTVAPDSVESVLEAARRLMYSAKRSGKNAVRYDVVDTEVLSFDNGLAEMQGRSPQ